MYEANATVSPWDASITRKMPYSRVSRSRKRATKRRKRHTVTTSTDPTMENETVYVLARGTVLFTGADRPPERHIFLTPHRPLAEMYARLTPGGKVFRYVTTERIRLVRKESVQWALRKGKRPKGEWDGFGGDTADYATATAVCRQRERETSWLRGYGGWIYKFSNPTLGEVMLCDDSSLSLRGSADA